MKNKLTKWPTLALWLFFLAWGSTATVQAQQAQQILDRCVQAFGGKTAITSVKYIKSSFLAHYHMLEQSERPTGPYIVGYEDGSEIKDLTNLAFRRELSSKSLLAQSKQVDIFEQGLLVRDFSGRAFPLPRDFGQQAQLYFLQSPIYILQQVLKNRASLQYQGKKILQGVPNYHLTFKLDQTSITLFINQYTHLLTSVALETELPHGFFWSIWGRFKAQVYYSLYHLLPGGVRYPQQWDLFRHALPYKTYTFTKVSLPQTITEQEQAQLKIAPKTRAMAKRSNRGNVQSLKIKPKGKFTISDGLFGWKHNWNVGVVVQENGIYILEAPMSSGYSQQIIQAIKQQYPDKKIKGVICTSDAWPHIGGVRQYVADGIPIYTQQLNQPILQRIAKANHAAYPDALKKKPKKARFRLLNKKLVLDDPTTPMEIVPANGEGAERMLFIYFPKQKTLYASDMVQYSARRKSFFMPQYLSEVNQVVQQEKWEVDTVFAMHTAPMSWQKVIDAIKKAKQTNK
ncbi:MAG TPA: hypothetical protein DCS93_16590 [Microscillaceae bacterium]|nr:hypothetical protein [Microscillaceae bacterium]